MTTAEHRKQWANIVAATDALLDGLDLSVQKDCSEALAMLDILVSLTLIAAMNDDHRKAMLMLHEGLTPSVERWIARHAASMEAER